ncbi:MAG: hypothetical protein KatS3mg011_2126 [Acidimicrobiia bacterium]|nr:MAG: hypothetical protein KatS3mg011_2126 [Acidimicrobiia bacterium]
MTPSIGQVSEVLRIANCSGFYGDRLSAAREMVEGGPIDVLTGDYLAELTMAILWRSRARDPDGGYATTFLAQMEEVLATCVEKGIKVVSNAGGLNPRGLAERLRKLAGDLGLEVRIATVEGDDLLGRLDELQDAGEMLANMDTGVPLAGSGVTPVTANAYLGGWGIARALARGADVVITGRVTDAALVIGPAAWRFGWGRHDWDRLAGALVAGHVIECGAQATGGNYAFFREVPGLDHVGFPLVEMRPDGSFVVTKHPGTGGLVSVGTVTAQLLYEIGGLRYLNPDVTARFDSIRLRQQGPDRVEVTGVKGEPPPPTVKVALNYLGGYRNTVTFVIPGLDVEEKARLAEEALWKAVGGRERFAETDVTLIRSDRPDPPTNEDALAYLRITVKDPDPDKVGRDAFSRKAVEMALAHYPGFVLTGPPEDARPYAVYWPTAVPAELVPQTVELGGEVEVVPPTGPVGPVEADVAPTPIPPAPTGPTRRAPLGLVAGARSGDKGGNANVGVWARDPVGYAWLAAYLTVDRFRRLIPEAAGLEVERYEFPNLNALNFVVKGLLGEGVSSSTRTDPQAKTLGEYLRAKLVDVPEALLDDR